MRCITPSPVRHSGTERRRRNGTHLPGPVLDRKLALQSARLDERLERNLRCAHQPRVLQVGVRIVEQMNLWGRAIAVRCYGANKMEVRLDFTASSRYEAALGRCFRFLSLGHVWY